MIRERASNPKVSFGDLIQTDATLFLRSFLEPQGDRAGFWWPRLLVYAEHTSTFELFVRAEEASFFQRLCPVLGVESADELRANWNTVIAETNVPPIGQWMTGPGRYAELFNMDRLASA